MTKTPAKRFPAIDGLPEDIRSRSGAILRWHAYGLGSMTCCRFDGHKLS